jgi:hypothetical protein
VGEEPEQQTGYKARVNRNPSNGTTAPSRKSFLMYFSLSLDHHSMLYLKTHRPRGDRPSGHVPKRAMRIRIVLKDYIDGAGSKINRILERKGTQITVVEDQSCEQAETKN